MKTSLLIIILSIHQSYGETWQIIASGTNHDLTGIAWDGQRFLAVDDEGGILESSTGQSWIRKQTASFGFEEILIGNGQYLALEGDSGYYHSTNRQTWTKEQTGQSNWITGGIFTAGKFHLVGEYGTILSSTDGLSWDGVTTSPTSADLKRIAFGGGLYVTVGDQGIFTSPDAIIWTKRTAATTYGFSDVAFYGDRFIATAFIDSKIFTSTTGASWSQKTIDTFSNTFPNLPPWGNSIVGGADGFKIVCDSGKAFHTNDGLTLTPITTQTTSRFNDIAYGHGTYVAVGENGLIRRYQPFTELQAWRMQNFGSIDNTGKGADANDYDKDGITNLIEYAMGSHPKQFSVLPQPQITGNSLVLSFTQARTEGISLSVEVSETLRSNEWTTMTPTGTFPTRNFSSPISGKKRQFMRFKVVSE